MVLAATAATRGGELASRSGALASDSERYRDRSEFSIRLLEREINKLAQASAAEANLCMINLAMACGDWPEVQRLAANVRRLGTGFAVDVDRFEMVAALNLGYFARAAVLYRVLARPESGILGWVLPAGLICASFSDLIHASKKAAAATIELSEVGRAALEVAVDANAALQVLHVSDDDVRAMIEIAGEVLREHELFWLDRLPMVRVMNDADGTGLLYEFRVAVDATTACELTDEVLDRLIERELDRPGVTFSFCGSPAQEARA